MQKAEVKVACRWGIHARVAFGFSRKSGEFKSSVRISNSEQSGDGKEVMDILALGAGPESTVLIETEGEDEIPALETLTRYLSVETGEI